MAQWIGLAKSAHMLGISRRELQKLVLNGELLTFEGCVDFEELRRRFPALAMEEGSIMERIAFLQETAFSRRVRATVMPDTDDLAAQLKRRTADHAVERARAEKYCAILRDLAGQMTVLQADATPETRRAIEQLNIWLLERLDRR